MVDLLSDFSHLDDVSKEAREFVSEKQAQNKGANKFLGQNRNAQPREAWEKKCRIKPSTCPNATRDKLT